MNEIQPNTRHIPEIQGLRAIAIILVILAHAGVHGLHGGFIGVDIFFVLSGFLITGLLLKEHENKGQIDILGFYARRLRRLLPALLVMLIVSLAAASFLLSSYELVSRTKSLFYSLTWTSNLYFALAEIDYFAELASSDLFLHTWSLGVEEQFYIIWPFLLLTLLALLRPTKQQFIYRILIAFALITAASWALALYWMEERPMWSYYMMPARIWQFSLGACVYLATQTNLFKRTQSLHQISKPRTVLQAVAVLVLIASLIELASAQPYPGYWSLAPAIFTALMLLSITNTVGAHNAVLANPALTWIGDRSYSWYLWHWPVFMLGTSILDPEAVSTKATLILGSLLLAAFTYKFIERPIWKGRFRNAGTGRSISASLIAIFAAVAVSLQLLSRIEHRPDTELQSLVQNAVQDIPEVYRYGCDTWYSSAAVEPCVFSAEDYEKTLVLLGDSILLQWFSLFTSIYAPPEWRIIVYTKSACPMVDEDFFYARIGKMFDVCSDWRDSVIKNIAELRPELVVMGSAANTFFSPQQWTEGTSRVLSELTKSSNLIYLVPGTPKLPFDGPACLLRALSEGHASESMKNITESCQHADDQSIAEGVVSHLNVAASGFDNVDVLNLNTLVCPDGRCRALNESGVVVFRDSQHLTDAFVRSLIPLLRGRVRAL